MCRHAAYAGPGVGVHELVFGLPHDLEHQAYQARELLTGSVCADGYGVAWYGEGRAAPARFVDPHPVWSDVNLRSFGPAVRSGMVLAWIRNATVAGGNHPANTQPFTDEASGMAFAHNGLLEGFKDGWLDWFLDDELPAERRKCIKGDTDSEHIFQALLGRREREQGEPLAATVQGLVKDLVQQGRALERQVQLNLLVADGQHLVATRCGDTERQNSLYLLVDGDEFPDGLVVASEPLYDDPAWEPVEPNTVVSLQVGAPPVRLTV